MQKEMMKFTASELAISEIEKIFRGADGRQLAHVGQVAIYFTDIPQLGYTSALMVSPIDQVLLWAPDSVYQFSIPVSRPSERRVKWTQALAESKASKKKFIQALKQGGSSMDRLPYGSVAYLGHDMGLDELWSQQSAPLWPGWYRVYAFPAAAGAKESFLDRLAKWFDAVAPFGTRAVPDAKATSRFGEELDAAALRDSALFEREPQSERARTYREEYDQILSILKHEIEKVEIGQAMTIDDLSVGFQVGDCRLRLIDYGVKDERRRLSEAVGKYRAHLLRVLRWPIFVEIAAAEIAGNERVGRVLPAYGSEPAPYDGWEELNAYLHDMRLSYPAFFSDPLEDLYPQ